jgi:hypothetical protein
MSMTLIQTKTLVAAAASIEFTSIPQDGTDLVVLHAGRMAVVVGGGFNIQFNNVATNYSRRNLTGNSSTASSFNGLDGEAGNFNDGGRGGSATFANGRIYITNYSAAVNKTWSYESVNENNAATNDLALGNGVWENTAAITSLKLTPATAQNIAIGSTVSLYKITKGSSGGVVVS